MTNNTEVRPAAGPDADELHVMPVTLRRWLEEAREWRGTELGQVSAWPPLLLSAVASCLPLGTVTILWGPRLLRIYGPDFAAIVGDDHPMLLGEPAAHSWPQEWATLAQSVDEVRRTRDVVTAHDVATRADVNGLVQRKYADVTYTPIYAHDTGDIAGIALSVRDTTLEVLDRARADSLARLGRVSVSRRSTASTACRAITAVMVAEDDITAIATVLTPRRPIHPTTIPPGQGTGRTTVESSSDVVAGFVELVERVQACMAVGCKQIAAGCRFHTIASPTPERVADAEACAIPIWSDGTRAAAECRKMSGLGGIDDIGRMVIALDPSILQSDTQRAFLGRTTEHVERILTDARSGNSDREQVESLRKALDTNRTVGAAMGVLIALRHVQPDEAFDMLRRASQQTNQKLREVSEAVLLTGTLPERIRQSTD